MDSKELASLLSPLPIPEVRFYETVGSTNTLAKEWIERGAPDLALVAADEQTAGRGRFSRHWVTQRGAALAFSLVTRPAGKELQALQHLAPWGALGVVDAIDRVAGLKAEIKWPNDVLIRRHKVCGILVEPVFLGNQLQAVVTGIGVNVSPESIPPANQTLFPVTSVESELGQPVNRWQLLREILSSMLAWRPRLGSPDFLQAWDTHLAFKDERVILSSGYASEADRIGRIKGIDADGALLLIDEQGNTFAASIGEVHLRPAGDDPNG